MEIIIKNKHLSAIYTNILDAVPNDHSRQVTAQYFINRILQEAFIGNVMDLGCGTGRSLDYFHAYPAVHWVGVDIEHSPEVAARNRTDGEFVTYDGVHLPFENNRFDMVLSIQVLEHTVHPRQVIGEIARVLKPGGYFVGSTSHLEPYHSYSLFNYTPYAFKILVTEAGLLLEEIRPGIDGLTLIIRKLLKNPKWFARYWRKESPLNKLIGMEGRLRKRCPAEVNLVKLVFCGHFAFLARKPAV